MSYKSSPGSEGSSDSTRSTGPTGSIPSGDVAEERLGFTRKEMMIVQSARWLEGERVCFVGVGMPNIAVNP